MSGKAYRVWSRFIHRFGYHHMELSYPQDRTGRCEVVAWCHWCGLRDRVYNDGPSGGDMHRAIAVVTSDHVYRIRRLHRDSHGVCVEDGSDYPCATIRILDRRPDEVEGTVDPVQRVGIEGGPSPLQGNIADSCCGKCIGPCYVDQITGA